MLHYLRNSSLPIFNNINEEREFFSELNFWKIPLIRKKIQFEFDPKWCCSIFTLDKSNTLLKKNLFLKLTISTNFNSSSFKPNFKNWS